MARVEELKTENIQSIRKCFYQSRHPWTRPELSERTGLSMAGTLNVLKVLLERGEIRYEGDAPSTGGRKSKLYALSPDYAHVGMMFLTRGAGRFTSSVSGMNLNGDEVWREHYEENAVSLKDVLEIQQRLLRKDPLIRMMVIGVPGIVEPDGSLLANDFPSFSGVPLKKELELHSALPVQVENDVNLVAAGYAQIHSSCRNLAVLYQPDENGAGIGLVIDGRLYRGFHGYAGELGRLSTERQLAALRKDPVRLLQTQLGILACIAAPERIGWYCPLVHETVLFPEAMDVPQEARPVLEQLDSLERLSAIGAEWFGRMGLLRELSF